MPLVVKKNACLLHGCFGPHPEERKTSTSERDYKNDTIFYFLNKGEKNFRKVFLYEPSFTESNNTLAALNSVKRKIPLLNFSTFVTL